MEKDIIITKVPIYEARTEGKNKIGRPRKTWEEQVCGAVKERSVSWDETGR